MYNKETILHYNLNVINPKGIADTAIKSIAAAGKERDDESVRLSAWFSPAIFMNSYILSVGIGCVIGCCRTAIAILEPHVRLKICF